jgi:hypothetical protein
MNKLISLVALVSLLTLSSFKVEDEVTIARVDPLTKVFPENVAFRSMNGAVEIAAGEHAVFQYAVHSGFSIKNLHVSCGNLKNKDGMSLNNIHIGFVGYVGVGFPLGQRPHDVLSSSTGLFPDPILDEKECSVPNGQTQSVWITVSTTNTAKPGLYKGYLSFQGSMSGSLFNIKREIEVKIYPVVLEEPSFLSLNWYHDTVSNLTLFNGGKKAELFSDAHWKFIEALAKKMKEAHQNVALVDPLKHIDFNQNGDIYSFDFSHFDKIIEIFQKAGIMKMIAGTHLGDRSTGAWTSPYYLHVPEKENGKMVDQLYPLDNSKTQNFYKQFIPALMNHLKQKGWDKNYYQHIADEPIDQNADSYIAIAEFIKSLAPNIRIIEACQSTKLVDVIDVWIPDLMSYKSNYEFFKNRQKQGNQVWFYTCCFPQGEYVNRFIELPLIKTRFVYWLAFNYGAIGYLLYRKSLYPEVNNKSWSQLLSEKRDLWRAPYTQNLLIQPVHSPNWIYVCPSMAVSRRTVTEGVSNQDAEKCNLAKTQEDLVVQFAFDDPAFVPDFRLTNLESV